jgi:hypothetical protein
MSAVQTLHAIRTGFFESGCNPGEFDGGRGWWVFADGVHEDQRPFLRIVEECLRGRAGERPDGVELEIMIERVELEVACGIKREG